MEYLKLDKKAIKSWRIARSITLILFAIFLVGWIVASVVLDFPVTVKVVSFIIYGVILLLLLLSLLVYPSIEYRQWKYLITEDRVEIIHGIFFVRKTIIPIIRIQNITVSQGPINRKLGLYKVEITIASDSFDIPCLSKEVADEISKNLKERIYTRLASRGVK